MDTRRIDGAIDTTAMAGKWVFQAGVGGGVGIGRDLVRCGLGAIDLCDPDTVGEENLCRQEHMRDQVGQFKVSAAAAELKRINPLVRARPWETDVCAFTDEQVIELFSGVDVFVAATDSHAAQLRVSQMALLTGKPAVLAGMYRGGRAGDVAVLHPKFRSCYRCLFPTRQAKFERGSPNPPSDGATVMDAKILDAITAQVVVALLTAGADNRFGRLLQQLGDRQCLQIKLDPDWSLGGRDVVREGLGIPAGADGYFSFCTVARRDPDPGGLCPDCQKYRLGMPPAA